MSGDGMLVGRTGLCRRWQEAQQPGRAAGREPGRCGLAAYRPISLPLPPPQVLLMFGPEYARACGIAALEPLGVFLPGDKNYPGDTHICAMGSLTCTAPAALRYGVQLALLLLVLLLLLTPLTYPRPFPQAAGCLTLSIWRQTPSGTSACGSAKSRTAGWRWWPGSVLRRRRRPRGRAPPRTCSMPWRHCATDG